MGISKSGLAVAAALFIIFAAAWSADSRAQAAAASPLKSGHFTGPKVRLDDAAYNARMDEVDALMKTAEQAADRSDFKGAIATLEKARDLCETYLGEGPDLVIVLQMEEMDYAQSGDYKNAEAAGKRSLAIADAIYDDTSERKLLSVMNLGVFYLRTNRLSEAEPLLTRALKLSDTVTDENAPPKAYIMNSLIELYRRTGRKADADAMQKRLDAMAAHKN